MYRPHRKFSGFCYPSNQSYRIRRKVLKSITLVFIDVGKLKTNKFLYGMTLDVVQDSDIRISD